MNPTDVAVGIILNPEKTKVLVAQRVAKDAHYGKWEFPGGKLDHGESAEQALQRELNEELGIKVTAFERFKLLSFDYPDRRVRLHFFLVTDYQGCPQGLECQTIDWINLSNLNRLNMLRANQQIIKQLKKMGSESN